MGKSDRPALDREQLDSINELFDYVLSTADSPCTRRQYITNIVNLMDPDNSVMATNTRVTGCCDGQCARDRLKITHGQRVEVGAEVHSEAAALIDAHLPNDPRYYLFLLCGQNVYGNTKQELFGKAVYPCHSCGMMIKYAGFTHILIRTSPGVIEEVSIEDILSERESEWDVSS